MITLETNEKELQVLLVLIDASVRASGLRGAGDAINWVLKIEKALKDAALPVPDAAKPPT